jgi:hypothetical protein
VFTKQKGLTMGRLKDTFIETFNEAADGDPDAIGWLVSMGVCTNCGSPSPSNGELCGCCGMLWRCPQVAGNTYEDDE